MVDYQLQSIILPVLVCNDIVYRKYGCQLVPLTSTTPIHAIITYLNLLNDQYMIQVLIDWTTLIPGPRLSDQNYYWVTRLLIFLHDKLTKT